MRLSRLRYDRSFCAAIRTAPCFAADHPALLRQLAERRYWFDEGHLSSAGAEVYTRWLARQLIEAGVFER